MSRESGRIRDVEKKRVLDDVSRQRRARKALEALEQDNFHDDPHADLVMSKKVPKFQDNLDNKTRKKKSKSAEYYKTRFRKSLAQMIEDDKLTNEINYSTAVAKPSEKPDRHFCAVCGFPSNYTCTTCGSRYCCVKCLNTHQDTRCLKWTA
ncbi:zinc finger HIT domain-containing protein 1-like [Ctenocephalides felis]|uniref:zinc finger HIT domain-containing protein 1-like n=1 Tax=Ctenocephalides felis TaxID=7515 RepID=UPI000E6E169D|nr:zinc finger HIT domain-containing protein 1-like [Ctenocephalides felis]XP_026468878.1 zinc finger HIT domain-containing protein 1-like [Ctenocephalides felis]XP_026469040.1 zinc finger HIT domain-containing protein 1-like [Ctenocephalides felis]